MLGYERTLPWWRCISCANQDPVRNAQSGGRHSPERPQPPSELDSPARLLSSSAAWQLFIQKIFSFVPNYNYFLSSRTSSTKLNALCYSSDHLRKLKAKALFPLLGSSLGSGYSFSPQVDLADLHPFMPAGETSPGSLCLCQLRHQARGSTAQAHSTTNPICEHCVWSL